MRLELGCGRHPTPGYTHHDRWAHAPWVDVAWDLNVVPWPWSDGSVRDVLALDVLEHLTLDVQDWLAELWRILAPEGLAVLRLPAYDNPVSWRDPTHRRVFHEETFDFWDRDKPLWQHYGCVYFPDGPWFSVQAVSRVNFDPRYGVGDLRFVLAKRDRPPATPAT